MPEDQKIPDDLKIETLCNHCGQAFSTFLHQMADQNSKVTCPSCGKELDHTSPNAGRPGRKH